MNCDYVCENYVIGIYMWIWGFCPLIVRNIKMSINELYGCKLIYIKKTTTTTTIIINYKWINILKICWVCYGVKKRGNILSVFWLWDIYIYIIYGLDYVRSKEKNWKRKEVKKSIGIENEILV